MSLKHFGVVSLFTLGSILSAQTPSSTPALIGALTDTPQHVFGAGAGLSTPTPFQASGWLAYGEKITGPLYSFTRMDLNVAKNGTFTTTTTTGGKVLIFQSGRLSFAVDGTIGVAAGATSAKDGETLTQFAYGSAGDMFIRLNKEPDFSAGAGNSYLVLGIGVIGTVRAPEQPSTIPQGNGMVFRIGFVRSLN